MIARVRSVIFDSSRLTSMQNVSGSLSTSTGIAPARQTARAQDMIVKEGKITSSPGPIPTAATPTSSAAVPLLTATPLERPQYLAHPASNSSKKGPADEI